ncbi:hypothetical protein P2318_21265 [Myxococcaceae bacterium GXIMD 01537]
MRKGTVAMAVCISLLSAGGAAWCHLREEALLSEAQWLMARGTAQAEEYAQRFDGSVADAQLRTFSQRRAVMEQAHLWQRGQMLGVLGSGLALLAAYGLFLLKRLEDQLVDAAPDLRDAHASPESAPALAPRPSTPH